MAKLTLPLLRAHPTPPGAITLWWLGQAGFILKSPGGKIVVLDPYLSNSCKALGASAGFDMDRQTPPPIQSEELGGMDLYALTHSHQDHLDPETLAACRAAGGRGPYLAPVETVAKLRALGVPEAETILIWPNQSHTVGDLALRATFAIPLAGDDLTHVGYLVSVWGGPTVYFTGDTAYHEILAIAVQPHRPDVLVTVINGAFRNLGPAEAARLAKQLEVKVVVPCHHDLFPDNSLPPQLLRTNLAVEGIAERYHPLQIGVPYTYPQ